MKFFKKFKFEIVIFLIFVILASIFTFPLILNLRTQIYDYKGDLLEALWYAWWVKYAWQHDLSPQFVNMVAAPFGIDLSNDITKNINLSFANYPLLVLTLLADEIFAYNLIMLFSFPLAGLAMYFLTYYFTRHKWGAFLAGLMFAFCPYHFAHASHITLANIQWMPLFILFLFKLHDERTLGSAALCGLFFALTLLSDTYYGYFMLVVCFIFVIFKIVFKIFHKKRVNFTPQVGFLKNLWLIILALLTAGLVCYPYAAPIVNSYVFKGGVVLSLHKYTRDISELYKYSAKLANYILPVSNHPFFGSLARSLKESIFYGDLQEGSLYTGLTTIFLAVFGFRFWKDKKKIQIQDKVEIEKTDFLINFFVFLMAAAFLFSLSPRFMILGRYIQMPSYYIFKMMPFFRAIARFGIVVMISLCVLAGFGFKFLIEKITNPYKKIAAAGFIIVLLIFEFLNMPQLRITPIGNPPEVYKWLKSKEGDFLVVEYPLGNDVEYLFNQRVHKKKLVNGALSGTEAYALREKISDILNPVSVKLLKDIGVEYIILHLDRYEQRSERDEIIRQIGNFNAAYGLLLVKDIDDVKVFKVEREFK